MLKDIFALNLNPITRRKLENLFMNTNLKGMSVDDYYYRQTMRHLYNLIKFFNKK